MNNNCTLNCEEGQAIIQDNNSCYRFPVFHAENVPPQFIVFNCVINILFLITTIFGNILVLSAVWKTTSLRSPSIILLCALATTDLAVGLVVQPLFLSMELIQLLSKEYQCVLGKASMTVSYSVCGASLFTVTAISLDRLLAVLYHLRYANMVTAPRVVYVMTLNWFVSGFLASFTLWSGPEAFLVVMATAVATCLCLSTYAHVKIYRVVRRHQQQIQSQREAVQAGNVFNVARFKRTAANAFLVHYFLLLCYTPLFIIMLLTSNKDTIPSALSTKAHSAIVWKLTTTIVFMNSALNPLIYCYRLREMRVAVKRTLKEVFCRI